MTIIIQLVYLTIVLYECVFQTLITVPAPGSQKIWQRSAPYVWMITNEVWHKSPLKMIKFTTFIAVIPLK